MDPGMVKAGFSGDDAPRAVFPLQWSTTLYHDYARMGNKILI
jgi:actin-related protein